MKEIAVTNYYCIMAILVVTISAWGIYNDWVGRKDKNWILNITLQNSFQAKALKMNVRSILDKINKIDLSRLAKTNLYL